MRKPTFCICENKDADQLRLVGVGAGRKPERWFSHDAAHISFIRFIPPLIKCMTVAAAQQNRQNDLCLHFLQTFRISLAQQALIKY